MLRDGERRIMSLCSRCGGTIDFITRDGRPIPIHRSGRCGGGAGLDSRWGRSEASESACFRTRCPEGCGADVFFIRHNGGSLWVDPPLGWPWPKHECLYPDDGGAGARSALGAFVTDEPDFSNADLILAVALEIEFSIDWSEWRLLSGENDEWRLHTNGDCRSLVGQLVVLDVAKHLLIPCFRRDLRFRVQGMDRSPTAPGVSS